MAKLREWRKPLILSKRRACGGLRFARSHIDACEHDRAEDEEHEHREHSGTARLKQANRRSKHGGAGDSCELLEDREEAETLRRLLLGDHASEQRSAERLTSALHGPNQEG